MRFVSPFSIRSKPTDFILNIQGTWLSVVSVTEVVEEMNNQKTLNCTVESRLPALFIQLSQTIQLELVLYFSVFVENFFFFSVSFNFFLFNKLVIFILEFSRSWFVVNLISWLNTYYKV